MSPKPAASAALLLYLLLSLHLKSLSLLAQYVGRCCSSCKQPDYGFE